MFIEKETKKINKKTVYYPFYESLKDFIKETFHIKYISNKVYYISLLSYLLGQYDIFFMTIPLVISVFIIFIYLLLNNYHFGSNNFKSLPKNIRLKLLKKYASNYQFIKCVMFLYHLIPILLCIQALNTFKEYNGTSYLQKNVIYYINSSIILILICICFSDMKYYDNIHLEYLIIILPITIFSLCLVLYN